MSEIISMTEFDSKQDAIKRFQLSEYAVLLDKNNEEDCLAFLDIVKPYAQFNPFWGEDIGMSPEEYVTDKCSGPYHFIAYGKLNGNMRATRKYVPVSEFLAFMQSRFDAEIKEDEFMNVLIGGV